MVLVSTQTALAFAVHNACAACVVDVLKIFARDMRLGDLLARSAQLHQRQVRSPAGGAGGASSGSGAGAGGMTAEAVEGLVTSVAEALDQVRAADVTVAVAVAAAVAVLVPMPVPVPVPVPVALCEFLTWWCAARVLGPVV